MLEALYPRSHGISVETANRRLESVSDIEVLVHHDYCGAEFAKPRVVKWADLAATDDESPSTTYFAAGPVTSHADGRPDNAIRALGRREGSVSTTPSQDASSAERLGELRDSECVARVPSPTYSGVARVPSPTSTSAVRVPSPALTCLGELSQPGGGARLPAMRLCYVGHRRLSDKAIRCDEQRPEPLSVSSLERQPLVSRMAAERRCKDVTAIQTIMQTSYDHDQHLRHTHTRKRERYTF